MNNIQNDFRNYSVIPIFVFSFLFTLAISRVPFPIKVLSTILHTCVCRSRVIIIRCFIFQRLSFCHPVPENPSLYSKAINSG